MKIVFFGTPDYVIPILDALHKEYKDKLGNSPIAAVVTQPPMPSGRKQLLIYSAVDTWAHKKKIPVYFEANQLIKNGVEAELGIIASYGAMIPNEVLEYFPKGVLNIHPSKLPEFRGASPVPAMLATGKQEAWVTIMKVVEQMDSGPIVTQFRDEIKEDDTTETLLTRLFDRSAEVLVGLIPAYLSGKVNLKEQDHKKAVYTKLIKKEDGYIPLQYLESTHRHAGPDPISASVPSWTIPFIYTKTKDGEKIPYNLQPTAHNLSSFIRALSPWPGVWTYINHNGKKLRLKLLSAHIEDEELVLDEVQLEGKNPVFWKQFKEAYKINY